MPVVDIAFGTEDDDYLLWEVVEVATTYGDPAIDLDAELVHRAPYPRRRRLRYSKHERHGLIEKAAADVNNGTPALVVCVYPEALRAPASQARLYEFHGGAVRARADEARHRPLLIARQSQIHAWISKGSPFVTRLTDLATKTYVDVGTVGSWTTSRSPKAEVTTIHGDVRFAPPKADIGSDTAHVCEGQKATSGTYLF